MSTDTERRVDLLAMAIRLGPSQHQVPLAFRPADRPVVTIDGLRVSLVRHLWKVILGPVPPNITKVCARPYCVNPYHFTSVSDRNLGPRRKVCTGCGNPYSQVDRLPSGGYACGTCRENRKVRRRRGGQPNWQREAAKTRCPANHEYTPDNTWYWTDARGSTHRKCKACARERASVRGS